MKPWAALLLAALLCGCETTSGVDRAWYKPWTWRPDKGADARKSSEEKDRVGNALLTNSAAILKVAGERVAATGTALSARTNREPATDLAEKFNKEAALLLPTPSVQDLKQLQAIVSGLLSTNAQDRAEAGKALDARDRLLADLQKSTGELRAKLESAEQSHSAAVDRLQNAYSQERGVADKWRQEQVKSWSQKLFDLLGTGGLIALAASGVLSIPAAGRIFGWMSQVMPGSATLTGVVSTQGFDRVVAGVESVRDTLKNRVNDAEISARVDDLLRIERSPTDVPLLNARRAKVRKRKALANL